METQLARLVEHYVALHLYDNAAFLAERLLAEAPTEAHRHLLASCLAFGGRRKQAAAVLAGGQAPANRYLFARCCVDLGLFREAEDALLRSAGLAPPPPPPLPAAATEAAAALAAAAELRALLASSPQRVPNGAAGVFLLAVCAHRTHRLERAAELYRAALLLDPFLFSAYEALAWLGEAPEAAAVFDDARIPDACAHPANAATAAEDGAAATVSLLRTPHSSMAAAALEKAKALAQPPHLPPAPQPHGLLPGGRSARPSASLSAAARQSAGTAPVSRRGAGVTGAGRGVGAGAVTAANGGLEEGDLVPGGTPPAVVVPSPLPSPITPAAKLPAVTPGTRMLRPGSAGSAAAATAAATTGGFVLSRAAGGGGLVTPALAVGHWPGLARGHPAFSFLSGAGRGGGAPGPAADASEVRETGPSHSPAPSSLATSEPSASASRLVGSMLAFSISSPGLCDPHVAPSGGGSGAGSRASAFVTPAASAQSLQRHPRGGARPGGGQGWGSALGGGGSLRGSSYAISEEKHEEEEDDSGRGSRDRGAKGDEAFGPSMDLDEHDGCTPASAVAFAPGPAGIIMGRRGTYGREPPHVSAAGAAAAAGHRDTQAPPGSAEAASAGLGDLSCVAGASPVPNASLLMDDGATPNFASAGAVPASATMGAVSFLSLAAAGAGGIASSGPKRQPSRLDVAPGTADDGVESMLSGSAPTPGSAASSITPFFGGPETAGVPAPPRKAAGRVGPPQVPTLAPGPGEGRGRGSGSPGKNLKRSLSDSQLSDEVLPSINVGPVSRPEAARSTAASDAAAESAGADEQAGPRPTVQEQLQRGSRLVLALLRALGSPLRALGQFQCGRAAYELQALPPRQRATGWVLATLGRAFYEGAKYAQARHAFEEMRAVAPERLEGLEIFSSVLWHLRLHNDLVHLSHAALAADRAAPQTWCVMANAVSAQHDHVRALLYLRRALQLDPACTYAHTLRGHELVATGDLEGATEAFREAIRRDARLYNAWYGLGTVLFKQQRLGAAEAHYRRACDIHPTSAVLQTYLGMVLAATDKHAEALRALQRACELDRGNAQARYQRAQVFSALGQHEQARLELLAVHEASPREPAVLVALGKACKKVGRLEEAVRFLNLALEAAAAAGGGHPALPADRKRHHVAGGKTDTTSNKIRELLANIGNQGEDDSSEWW